MLQGIIRQILKEALRDQRGKESVLNAIRKRYVGTYISVDDEVYLITDMEEYPEIYKFPEDNAEILFELDLSTPTKDIKIKSIVKIKLEIMEYFGIEVGFKYKDWV